MSPIRLLSATFAACLMAQTPSAVAESNTWLPEEGREFLRCLSTPAVEFHGTIVDAALATPDLKALADAVVAAGLAETLSGPGPFTVYAPTNAAFAKIPPAILSALVADRALLTAVLTYHVSPGKGRHLDPRQVLFQPREAKTVQGQTVFYSRNGDAQVNQANAACQPVRTTNGVVFLIDSVLLPQF